MTQKKRPRPHGPAAGTILVVLALVVFFFGTSRFIRGEGRSAGSYDDYAGPIMPLTTVSGGEGVTAQRYVDFDFSTYGEIYDPSIFDPSEVLITDTYQLTNETGEDKALSLAWPYVILTGKERGFFPTITADGQEVQPEIYFAMDTDRAFSRAKSFDYYKKRLAEKDYFASAMEKPVIADIPVKAYHFTDITYNGDRKGTTPFLTLTFTIPEGVSVWTREYDVLKNGEEKDSYTLWFRDSLDEEDAAWLFVSNGDIENLTFGGRLGRNVQGDGAPADVDYAYEIVETSFEDLMWKFAKEYVYRAEENYSGLITPEILYRDTMKRLGGTMGEGYDPMFGTVVHCVEDELEFAFLGTGLQYMVFPVTVPAGGSITVEGKYWKEASYFFDETNHREGYEIATQMGSDLHFTELTASIQNTQWIGIRNEDLGFGQDGGASQTTLDLSQERYSLVVSHKSKLEQEDVP